MSRKSPPLGNYTVLQCVHGNGQTSADSRNGTVWTPACRFIHKTPDGKTTLLFLHSSKTSTPSCPFQPGTIQTVCISRKAQSVLTSVPINAWYCITKHTLTFKKTKEKAECSFTLAIPVTRTRVYNLIRTNSSYKNRNGQLYIDQTVVHP